MSIASPNPLHDPRVMRAVYAPESTSIARCMQVVCDAFGVNRIGLISDRRARSIARPRQVVCWLAKQTTPHSLSVIGNALGGRDHTTVMHAIKVVEGLRATNQQFSDLTDRLLLQAQAVQK